MHVMASDSQEATQSDSQEVSQPEINTISETIKLETELVESDTKHKKEDINPEFLIEKETEEIRKELEKSKTELDTERSDNKILLKETEEIRKELEETKKELEKSKTELDTERSDNKILLKEKKNTDQILKNEKFEVKTIYVISGLLSLTLIISLVLIRFLLIWRQSIRDKDNQVSIVPHKLIDELSRQEKMLASFLNQTQNYQKENKSSDKEMIEILSTFRASIEEKEEELARWKKGYDLEIYKKFLIRFIDANEALEDAMENLESSQNNELISELNEAKELLEYALKATEVETFSPTIGDDIRDAFGIDEQYRTIPTKDENLVMTIAEVRKCGYFVRTAESKVCIIPAKVVVYVLNEEKKNEE